MTMKKINFGYSNESNPTGMFEGMGASPNYDIIKSDLLDIIELNNNVYLVSKVSMFFAGQENKIGTIDVREIVADLYPDGSGVIFSNQEKDDICKNLEKSLENAKSYLDKGMSVRTICDAHLPNDCYKFLVSRGGDLSLAVTGIKPEVFENKKKLISMCHNTFFHMQRELQEVYSKLDEYDNMYGNTNHR